VTCHSGTKRPLPAAPPGVMSLAATKAGRAWRPAPGTIRPTARRPGTPPPAGAAHLRGVLRGPGAKAGPVGGDPHVARGGLGSVLRLGDVELQLLGDVLAQGVVEHGQLELEGVLRETVLHVEGERSGLALARFQPVQHEAPLRMKMPTPERFFSVVIRAEGGPLARVLHLDEQADLLAALWATVHVALDVVDQLVGVGERRPFHALDRDGDGHRGGHVTVVLLELDRDVVHTGRCVADGDGDLQVRLAPGSMRPNTSSWPSNRSLDELIAARSLLVGPCRRFSP